MLSFDDLYNHGSKTGVALGGSEQRILRSFYDGLCFSDDESLQTLRSCMGWLNVAADELPEDDPLALAIGDLRAKVKSFLERHQR